MISKPCPAGLKNAAGDPFDQCYCTRDLDGVYWPNGAPAARVCVDDANWTGLVEDIKNSKEWGFALRNFSVDVMNALSKNPATFLRNLVNLAAQKTMYMGRPDACPKYMGMRDHPSTRDLA